jgi:hypothetical protein
MQEVAREERTYGTIAFTECPMAPLVSDQRGFIDGQMLQVNGGVINQLLKQ